MLWLSILHNAQAIAATAGNLGDINYGGQFAPGLALAALAIVAGRLDRPGAGQSREASRCWRLPAGPGRWQRVHRAADLEQDSGLKQGRVTAWELPAFPGAAQEPPQQGIPEE